MQEASSLRSIASVLVSFAAAIVFLFTIVSPAGAMSKTKSVVDVSVSIVETTNGPEFDVFINSVEGKAAKADRLVVTVLNDDGTVHETRIVDPVPTKVEIAFLDYSTTYVVQVESVRARGRKSSATIEYREAITTPANPNTSLGVTVTASSVGDGRWLLSADFSGMPTPTGLLSQHDSTFLIVGRIPFGDLVEGEPQVYSELVTFGDTPPSTILLRVNDNVLDGSIVYSETVPVIVVG